MWFLIFPVHTAKRLVPLLLLGATAVLASSPAYAVVQGPIVNRIATTSVLLNDFFNSVTLGSSRLITDAGVGDATLFNRANTDVLILARTLPTLTSGVTFTVDAPSLTAAARANIEAFLNQGGVVATEFSSNTIWFTSTSTVFSGLFNVAVTPLPNLAFPSSVTITGSDLTGFDCPIDFHTIVDPTSPIVAGIASPFRDDFCSPPAPGAGDLHFNLSGDLAGNGIAVVAQDSDETSGGAPTAIETIAVARRGNGLAVMMLSDWQDINSTNPSVIDPDIGRLWVNVANLTAVAPSADLAVTKADSPDPVAVGNLLTYTVTVANQGPSTATGVTLTDPLPSATTFDSATASQGFCSGTSTITCTLGTLASGASATVTIRVTPTTAGAFSNTATVAGNEADPNTANNTATATTTVKPGTTSTAVTAPLIVVPSTPGTTSGPQSIGDVLVTENAPGDLAAGDVITLTLPAGLTFALPPTASLVVSNGLILGTLTLSSPGQASLTIASPSTTGPATIRFSGLSVQVAASFLAPGVTSAPLRVAVGGSAGVTVASVQDATAVLQSNTPTLADVSPGRAGQGAQNLPVAISGVNIGAGASVFFQKAGATDTNIHVTGVTVNSSGTLMTFAVSVDAGTMAGLRDVVVTNDLLNPTTTSATLAGAFEVTAAPSVSCTDRTTTGECPTGTPAAGALLRGINFQRVNIIGAGFQPPGLSPLRVSFGPAGSGITVLAVGYYSETAIFADVNVGLTNDSGGAVTGQPVTVVNSDLGTATGGFVDVVDAPPGTVTGGAKTTTTTTTTDTTVAPSISSIVCATTGSNAGPRGCGITINGSNFGTAPTVIFAGPVCLGSGCALALTSASDTAIQLTVPGIAVDGPVTVTNTGTGKTSAGVNFDITSPRVSNVFFFPSAATTPEPAVFGSSGTLSITGSNFETPATVDILSPTGVTGVTVTSGITVDTVNQTIGVPISIVSPAPAGFPSDGLLDVRVTNPGGHGADTLVDAFRITAAPTVVVQLRLLDPVTLAPITERYLPTVGAVSVRLTSSGQCDFKTVSPTEVVVEAQFSPAPASGTLATFSIAPSNLPGTAYNEDCEVDNTTGTILPTATNDFSIAVAGGSPDVSRTVLSNVAETSAGIYRATLHSWDWGGNVTVQVTAGGATGSRRFPLDSDGDQLPDAFERNNALAGEGDLAALNAPVVLNFLNGDQDGDGTRDDVDRFARDGLSNFDKYRGVYLIGPANGQTRQMTDLAGNPRVERLGLGKRHLFVRGRGFGNDPLITASTGKCGIDPSTGQAVTDSLPCPLFQIGSAFEHLGVKVHNVSAAFGGYTSATDPNSLTTQFPRQSFRTPSSATLDMATVVLDGVNCNTSGTDCQRTWHDTGLRNWKPATVGFSGYGGTAYASNTKVYLKAIRSYLGDKPYRHPDNDLTRAVHASVGAADPSGLPILAPVTIVADANDNGVKDGGERVDSSGVLLGDSWFVGRFDQALSALDVNNDGCVEAPLVGDPTAIARCTNPTGPTSDVARDSAGNAITQQATLQQVTRVTVTHEVGHATGARHTLDTNDVMYDGILNWLDRDFSATSGAQVHIHNKGLE